jgi:predicted transcriptional regulator
MTIELPAGVERELRDLAVTQSRDVGELVKEAVLQYLALEDLALVHAIEEGEATELVGREEVFGLLGNTE